MLGRTGEGAGAETVGWAMGAGVWGTGAVAVGTGGGVGSGEDGRGTGLAAGACGGGAAGAGAGGASAAYLATWLRKVSKVVSGMLTQSMPSAFIWRSSWSRVWTAKLSVSRVMVCQNVKVL